MKIKILLTLVLIGLAIIIRFGEVHGQFSSTGGVEWKNYDDIRFDFSLKYPSSYIVEPRNDEIGGSVLTFRHPLLTSFNNDHGNYEESAQLVIGMYFVEWTETETIEEWTEKYHELVGLESDSDRNENISYSIIDGVQGLRVIDQSHSMTYQYVNIPRNGIVWFIWANGAVDTAIFDNVVASFQFGSNTPETLQDIYGQSFHPLSINGNGTQQNDDLLVTPGYLRVPLSGNASCNSGAHIGASQYAVDVAKAVGTPIYASQTGSVFYGWYPNAWGNLLILTTESWAGSYKVYYAHLSGYDEETLHSGPPFFYAYKDERIGWTGNTGNSTGPHLHLEVRNSSNDGVTLVGMSGFNAGTSYPTGATCGTLTR